MTDLIDRIRAAFANVPYPGDDRLTDSFGDEPDALRAAFAGRTDWTTLEPEFLDPAPDDWGSALSFFSAEALQFYLPAYLIADLGGHLDTADPSFRLCLFVTPQGGARRLAKFYGGGTLGDHARSEFARFSPGQVAVIVDYLWWKLDQDGYNPTIEQALEHYWLPRAAETEVDE
ncbi:DUF6714 family protein [Elongatibacter sediminis]|uniref:DUF6714 family protein n=1 Tax=Elongatibacter sediminis TaxID=3119006 RepID=A0AAW9RIF7_9GAMM